MLHKLTRDKLPLTPREKRTHTSYILLIFITMTFTFTITSCAVMGDAYSDETVIFSPYIPLSEARAEKRLEKKVKTSMKYKTKKLSTSETEQKIREIAREKNFQWEDYLIRLAYCENDTLNPKRRGDIDERDRGIFQINDYWHPEVSDECAFDLRCSTEWTMWRIESGWQHEWKCDELI